MKKIIFYSMTFLLGLVLSSGSCTPQETVAVQSISITPVNPTVMQGATVTLTAKVAPDIASNKSVTWSSLNTSIATVVNASTGVIRGVSVGTATIRATANDGSGVTKDISVTVTSIAVSSVSVSATTATMILENTQQLTANVLPAGASNKNVTWSSSNGAVATVSNTGLVTAVGDGAATITVTTVDGSKTATCAVTVDGVKLNGVIWATRNVDAFGTFAATPQSFGMLYQWNRATAYVPTGPLPPTPAWNTTSISSTWSSTNDPCPNGWTVPTMSDFEKLLDNVNVARTYPATEGGINGFRFTASGKSIFLPTVGARGTDGAYSGVGDSMYWTKTKFDNVYAYGFVFNPAIILGGNYLNALSIRCVKGAK